MIQNILNFIRRRIWSALPSSYTPRQCAWAAVLWGGALFALGIWRALKGHLESSVVLITAGAFIAALLLIPNTRSATYLTVMRFFSVIGFVVSTVLLTLAFYLFVTPMAWLFRLAGKDLLDIRSTAPPVWRDHAGKPDRKRYYRLS